MNKAPKNELSLMSWQELFSLISIIGIIISLTLLENEKRRLKKEPTLFSKKTAHNLTTFNRTLFVITAVGFLVINYLLRETSVREGENDKTYNLQIIASILTLAASLIALYVVKISSDKISDVENPII